MAERSPAPMLYSRVHSGVQPNRARKYGRNTYERFDDCTEGAVLAGHGSIGKVKVNCRFLFKKSRWGFLGGRHTPAGIIYLDLDFHQPSGSTLESASVQVNFSSPGDRDGHRRKLIKSKPVDNCKARLTHYYGPVQLKGEQRHVLELSSAQFIPELNVAGYGGGGVGGKKERAKIVARNWEFTGHLVPGKSWAFQRLRWELKENKLDEEPQHSNTIHTAFAFEHGDEDCVMTVEVSGKLRGWRDLVNNTLKFGGKDGTIATLIHFPTKMDWKNRLDERAQELCKSMEDKNLREVPVEIPNKRREQQETSSRLTPHKLEVEKPPRPGDAVDTHGLSIDLARAAGLVPWETTPPQPGCVTAAPEDPPLYSSTLGEVDTNKPHTPSQSVSSESAIDIKTVLQSVLARLRVMGLLQLITLVLFQNAASGTPKQSSQPSMATLPPPPKVRDDTVEWINGGTKTFKRARVSFDRDETWVEEVSDDRKSS